MSLYGGNFDCMDYQFRGKWVACHNLLDWNETTLVKRGSSITSIMVKGPSKSDLFAVRRPQAWVGAHFFETSSLYWGLSAQTRAYLLHGLDSLQKIVATLPSSRLWPPLTLSAPLSLVEEQNAKVCFHISFCN